MHIITGVYKGWAAMTAAPSPPHIAASCRRTKNCLDRSAVITTFTEKKSNHVHCIDYMHGISELQLPCC
jgi:hypothetical protein